MEHRPFEENMTAYLAGQLSGNERTAFEAELRSDAAKKKIFEVYYLAEMAARLQLPDRQTEIARQLRQELGPLPKPSLSFVGRLRYWLGSPRGWILVALVSIFLLSIIASYALLPDIRTLASHAMVEPYNGAVAGDDRPDEFFNIYFNDKPHAASRLQALAATCTDFCLARYYLAHAQLRNGDFEQAAVSFKLLLTQQPDWPAIVEEQKVKWNDWLTGSYLAESEATKQKTLTDFCNSPDPAVQLQARALRTKLNNPLRRLRFF